MHAKTTALVVLLCAACSDEPQDGAGGGSTTAATVSTSSAGGAGGASESCDDSDPVGPPCVEVPPSGPYGKHTFSVPAAAYWVNTGLYVVGGQEVSISANGTWRAGGTDLPETTGPEGHADAQERGCNVGSLTARVGLGYEDLEIECVGSGGTFAAPKSGILYVGAIVSEDLLDLYGARLANEGAISVTVISAGDTVPTVLAADAGAYDFASFTSGWVELRSKHTTVTTPAAIAQEDRETIADSLAVFDALYESHAALRGMTPFKGERIRWYPGTSVIAGNPNRVTPQFFEYPKPNERLLASSDAGHSVWWFAHLLGHDFANANGIWHYQQDTAQTWCDVFSVYTLRALERPDPKNNNDTNYPSEGFCPTKDAYLASGAYDLDFVGNYGLQLCFLLELEESYGFELYQDFYAVLNSLTPQQVPTEPPAAVWGWIRDELSTAAGEDVTPIFTKWRIPLP